MGLLYTVVAARKNVYIFTIYISQFYSY